MARIRFLGVLVCLSLSACGGGGGGGGSSSPPPSSNPPPPPPSNLAALSGSIAKGPLVSGSTVQILSVSAGGVVGGVLTSGTTTDALGAFDVDVERSQVVLLSGEGRFFDEIAAAPSASAIRLEAVVSVGSASQQVANANVLTHLIAPRILNLMSSGSSFVDAESQARNELLGELSGIAPGASSSAAFTGLALFSTSAGDTGSALLVTVSALVLEHASELSDQYSSDPVDELRGILDRFAADFADGVLDRSAEIEGVRRAAFKVDGAGVTAALSNLASTSGSSLVAGDAELILDSDQDGIANADDSDIDGDGIANVDDAFPEDWGCYLPEHSVSGTCSFANDLPSTVFRNNAVLGSDGVLYLLNADAQKVFRWSPDRGIFGYPIDIPFGARALAFSSSWNRLLIGIQDGQILSLDPNSGQPPTVFAAPSNGVDLLTAAGEYLVVADGIRNWFSLNSDGEIVDQRSSQELSNNLEWNPATNQLFSVAGNIFNRLFYSVAVDPATGVFGASVIAENPRAFLLEGILSISSDGERILSGSGDVFDANMLSWQRSMPGIKWDSAWLDDGTMVAISRTRSNDTLLERRGALGELIESVVFSDQPIRVIPYRGRLLVITVGNTIAIEVFDVGGDLDRDGVANASDSFPTDVAASIDSDRDGFPDVWNAGFDESDSTSGLQLDAFPQDSACTQSFQGDGAQCDIAFGVGSYEPDSMVVDSRGHLYLLDREGGRIIRTDSDSNLLNPLIIKEATVDAALSMRIDPALDRLYVGYLSGEIVFFDLSDPGDQLYFASLPIQFGAIEVAGNYLWAAQPGNIRYAITFDADGSFVDLAPDARFIGGTVWNAALSRVMSLSNRGNTSLHYQEVNPATGEIGPVLGDINEVIRDPREIIRVSLDGSRILTGNGGIFDATDLSPVSTIPGEFVDAQWGEGGETIVVRRRFDFPTQTRIERRSQAGLIVELAEVTGRPTVLVRDNGVFRFHTSGGLFYRYRPSNDTDADGVDNAQDAFPLDPAASLDTDFDGLPDAWNDGLSEADSNTGLVLDAFPNDAACQTAEQGDGTTCDIAASIPDYRPDRIRIGNDGLVYLLNRFDRRVYRWDPQAQQYLNPFVIGNDPWLGDRLPSQMEYHPGHERLYLTYDAAGVKFIDLSAEPGEQYLNFIESTGDLAATGNFLVIEARPTGSDTHYVLDDVGTTRDELSSDRSPSYAWDSTRSRLYFLSDFSADANIEYEVVDQATGVFSGTGTSIVSGSQFSSAAPVRISQDGARLVIGSGFVFDPASFAITATLPSSVTDAVWLPDGRLVTIKADGPDTLVETLSASFEVQSSQSISGEPLRVLPLGNALIVITQLARPQFSIITP